MRTQKYGSMSHKCAQHIHCFLKGNIYAQNNYVIYLERGYDNI